MKKLNFFLLILVLVTPLFCVNAAVPAGYITTAPTISTAASPVWYNMMSTNVATAPTRMNRYMFYNDTTFTVNTRQFNLGITSDIQNDKYIWRLEQGSASGTVIIVNKASGRKLWIAPEAVFGNFVRAAAPDTTGVEWTMSAASDISGSLVTTPGQFALNYIGGATDRFLNAADVASGYRVVVFNTTASVGKNSGWYFYPVLASGITDTKYMKGISPNPFTNTLKIENKLEGSKIYMYDASGKQVMSSNLNLLNTTSLQKGTYLVKFTTADGVKTIKAVKE